LSLLPLFFSKILDFLPKRKFVREDGEHLLKITNLNDNFWRKIGL
jgi:hypothetical protein